MVSKHLVATVEVEWKVNADLYNIKNTFMNNYLYIDKNNIRNGQVYGIIFSGDKKWK